MKKIIPAAIGIISLAVVNSQGSTTTLFDSLGFEGPTYTLGALGGQNGWFTDGTGLGTVQNTFVQSGSQAVRLSGASTTWHYPDLSYTPGAGEIVSISAGIAFGSSATATKNFGYFLDAYNFSVARIGRVGLGISGGLPAVIASTIGGGGPGNYLIQTGLAFDTYYNFQMDLKFATQNYDLYVNNVLIGADLPFLNAASNLADVDLMMSATAGATDVGYFDNYSVITTVPVPEPGTLTLAALGGFALIAARRHRAVAK